MLILKLSHLTAFSFLQSLSNSQSSKITVLYRAAQYNMIVFTQSNELQYFMLFQNGNCWQGKLLVILSTDAKKPLCIISLDLMATKGTVP